MRGQVLCISLEVCAGLTLSSFVQACVKEALRIFGPVPMGLPRIAPKGGLVIGDRVIPEGTIVSINRESIIPVEVVCWLS